MKASTLSPAVSLLTPAGVPVNMRSPVQQFNEQRMQWYVWERQGKGEWVWGMGEDTAEAKAKANDAPGTMGKCAFT